MGGMTRLLLLLWAGVTVGSVVDLQKRIVGGKPCPKAERGYHAFITINDGTNNFACSGSLIHKQWILTAAHCWKAGRTVKAVLGPHTDKPTPVKIELPPLIFEEKDDKTKKHDIMLLKLKKPTAIPPVPLPVRLPDCANKPTKGKTVQIAGYYSTIQPHDIKDPGHLVTSKPLQCADIKVVKCDAGCQAVNEPYTRPLEHLLCYQDKKVDASTGDSGGGVVFKDKIYGVHVTGKGKTCSGPAKAMDLCKDIYKKWILETIAANSGG